MIVSWCFLRSIFLFWKRSFRKLILAVLQCPEWLPICRRVFISLFFGVILVRLSAVILANSLIDFLPLSTKCSILLSVSVDNDFLGTVCIKVSLYFSINKPKTEGCCALWSDGVGSRQ